MSQTSAQSATPGEEVGFERAFADDEHLAHLGHAARRILAMSAALFYRQGAAATSVRDITSACGLSPGALYKHFASKDDLLDLLVRGGHDRIEARVERSLAEAGSQPADRLPAFVRAYVGAHLERPELAQLVRREYRHLSAPPHQRIVACRRRMRNRLVDIVRAGQSAGVFVPIDARRDDAAATAVAIMVLDMCSRTSEWYDRARSDPPDVVAERYVAATLRLVGAA